MWFRHDNKANNGVSILFTRFSHHIGTDENNFHNSLELGTHNISQFNLKNVHNYTFVQLLLGMIHYRQNLLFVPCDK